MVGREEIHPDIGWASEVRWMSTVGLGSEPDPLTGNASENKKVNMKQPRKQKKVNFPVEIHVSMSGRITVRLYIHSLSPWQFDLSLSMSRYVMVH
jgi:hypothetical protein